MFLFYPLVKVFTFISRMIFRPVRRSSAELSRATTEEETKALLHSGIKGLPAHRKDMIAEIFDLASRPVKEIMTPRPRIKAIEARRTGNRFSTPSWPRVSAAFPSTAAGWTISRA